MTASPIVFTTAPRCAPTIANTSSKWRLISTNAAGSPRVAIERGRADDVDEQERLLADAEPHVGGDVLLGEQVAEVLEAEELPGAQRVVAPRGLLDPQHLGRISLVARLERGVRRRPDDGARGVLLHRTSCGSSKPLPSAPARSTSRYQPPSRSNHTR